MPALKGLKRSAAASTGSFDWQLRPATQAHSHLLLFARHQKPKTLRGSFDQACRPQPSATIGVRGCRLPALKGLKRSVAASSRPQPSATIGVRGCRLPALKGLKHPKTFKRSAEALCYYRRSRLPFARPQRPKTLRDSFDQALRPQPSATISVRGCRLPALKGLKRSAGACTGSLDQALRPQPSATIGVRSCHLPALKGLKPSAAASTGSFYQALRPQPSAPIGIYRRSRLPSARPQT